MKLPERGAEHCVDLLRAFNKEGVEYLIGGSMARSHYCSVPRVRDMDVVINPTLENATKVKPVLDDFVYRLSGFMAKQFTLEALAKPGGSGADRIVGAIRPGMRPGDAAYAAYAAMT